MIYFIIHYLKKMGQFLLQNNFTYLLTLTYNKMLQNSLISDPKISKSLQRLKNVSSDKKFRVKSLRIKTQQKSKQTFNSLSPKKQSSHKILSSNSLDRKILQKLDLTQPSLPLINFINSNHPKIRSSLLQKNYQHELINNFNIKKQFLLELFKLKLSEDQIVKFKQDKYQQFLKIFYLRLHNKVQLAVDGFNFKNKSLELFLLWYLNEWKDRHHIISLDLSNCKGLCYQIKTTEQQEQESIKLTLMKKNEIIQNNNVASFDDLWPKYQLLKNIVLKDEKIKKLIIKNIHITPDQMVDLLSCVLKKKTLYSLDISNKGSQAINRLGMDCYYLQAFFARNDTLGVIKMDNLNINDQTMQRIANGMLRNQSNSLRILSLSNNFITEKSLNCLQNIITKCGLEELNLSHNPLGHQFFINTKNWRSTNLKHLDLSSTQMTSESLIHFIQNIIENKSLEQLILDKNDFSHHWFNKIKQILEVNSSWSLKSLSMIDCGIKSMNPIFEGIVHAKNLKKLNLNYNLTTIQAQNIQKICECFRINKILSEVRLRFCGYNEQMLIQLIKSLKQNSFLEILDISENHLSDRGGKQLLKLLASNSNLKSVGIEKLQLTVRMSEQIQRHLKHNKQLRNQRDNKTLIEQNKVFKLKDNCTWKDIERLGNENKRLSVIINEVMKKNQKIQKKIQQKRQIITQIKRDYKEEERMRNLLIKKQQQIINQKIKKVGEEIQRMTLLQKQATMSIQIENNLIRTLQMKIQKQNQKIKKRENQLEDRLRDQKYLHKKRQKQKSSARIIRKSVNQLNQKIVESKLFDNTKSKTGLMKRNDSLTMGKKG